MDETKIGWYRSASKFEKIFWATILLLLLLFIVLQFLASRHYYQGGDKAKSNHATKEIFKEIEAIVDSNKIGRNLENNITQQAILESFHKTTLELNQTINREIEQLFGGVEGNLEGFLDFHYSVIGEYIELGAMATGAIEEEIRKRLFGEIFAQQTTRAFENIATGYHASVKNHLDFIHSNATEGVESELNREVLGRLTANIHQNILIQQGKLATLMTVAIAAKITKTIATKLAIKQASTITAKVASKTAIKTAAAASGASAGVLCGPFVWVCAPVAATVMWFGTDEVVITIDEHFNRDDFRRDITMELENQKQTLKHQLQREYTQALQTISTNTLKKYQETSTKERRKIKELILN